MSEKETTTAAVAVPSNKLFEKFGSLYSVEPDQVYRTLCATAFSEAKSAQQVVALLIVADQYGLNPFTKEIYAFPDRNGGVVPVVGIDGWNRIAQQHPQFDGLDLRYSDDLDTINGARPCPRWVEAVIYRKDRSHPIVVREYLAECFRETQPWKSHTSRMLRHKAIIQGYRLAFGFHGIYDPDEAEGFEGIDLPAIVPNPGRHGKGGGEASTLVLDVSPELTASTLAKIEVQASEQIDASVNVIEGDTGL